MTHGVNEVPTGLARRILFDHLCLSGIMVVLLLIEIVAVRATNRVVKIETKTV